jgi:hypothetical protein
MRTATAVNVADQHAFARVLGKRPRLRTAKSSTVDQFGLFVETFGPPERARRRNGNLLFWNFVRKDAAGGFSLFARVSRAAKLHPRSEVEIQLAARSGVVSFQNWTADRLAGVESGEDNPLLIGGRAFVMEPINWGPWPFGAIRTFENHKIEE